MIHYGKQSINQDDVKNISNAITGDYLTCGPTIELFEKKFSEYVNAKYAIAVSSGTAALHLACLAAGLNKLNELITSPLTFVASSNCALYCGAKPVFADVNQYGLIDSNDIAKKITKKTKIIIPVHYAGQSCDLESIHKIAQKQEIMIIEDACHALGATYKKSKIGDCKYSDMCVFSFHPVKHITTGEGGIITTNSKELYEKLKILRHHGIRKKKNEQDPWVQDMIYLGFNYRITDFQCALGISQMKKIREFLKRRREIAKKYTEAFKNTPEIEIPVENINDHAFHLFVILLHDEDKRRKMYNSLLKNMINCQVHYMPVYKNTYYQDNGNYEICINAEQFYNRCLSIPIYPMLKDTDVEMIINAIKDSI